MAQILSDGTVIPSYLFTNARGQDSSINDPLLNNIVLRYGEIRHIVYPPDDRNFTKSQVEYEVEVQHRDGSGVTASSLYRGVTANNFLGGFADKFHVTYRPSGQNSTDATGLGTGSKVLLMCIGGDTQKAVILGGINDQKLDSTVAQSTDGHNLFFEFNGVRFVVKDNGSCQFLWRGPTQADGTLTSKASSTASGSSITVNTGGSVTIATPNDDQTFVMDQDRKRITFTAHDKWELISRGKVEITADDDIDVIGHSGCTIAIDGNIKITGNKILMNGANEAYLLGTTYRGQEKLLHNIHATLIETIAAELDTIGAAMTTAAVLNAIPVTGGLLAMPEFAIIAQAFIALGPMFLELSSAIQDFESFGDMLSEKIFGSQ